MLVDDDMANEIEKAKLAKKIIFLPNATKNIIDWNSFYSIFKKAFEVDKADFASFGTLTIDNSEAYTKDLDTIINVLSSWHTGKKIAALCIVHFLNSHDNVIPENATDFASDFFAANPNKLPPGFDVKLFKPTIHSDPVDGFYVQCEGNTIWRAFYGEVVEEFFVSPGDILYIPSGVDHSVESMNVRAAVSVSFFDKE